MIKLTDTQAILLSTAAQRETGSIYPLPATLAADNAKSRVAKAIAPLIAHDLIEERETTDPATAQRLGGDLRYGLFITAAGLAAIGAGEDNVDAQPSEPQPKSPTKSATVLDLLRHPEGATLADLIAATGWLPHTTRAALTGLRKKGHAIERGRRGTDTCYRIASAA